MIGSGGRGVDDADARYGRRRRSLGPRGRVRARPRRGTRRGARPRRRPRARRPAISRENASHRTRGASYRHVPATAPSTRNVPIDCGIFVEKIARPVLLREDAGAPRVDEQDRVPGREEAHRRRRLGVRERSAREIEELAAGLVAEATQREALERGLEQARLHPRPQPDVGARRGPERAEVAADEVVERCLRDRRPPARPSARPSGRGAHVASPTSPTAGRARARATARRRPSCARRPPTSSSCRSGPSAMSARNCSACRSRSRSLGRGFLHAEPPLALRPADRDGERPEVAPRDDVDRPAHERRLDHASDARARA